MITIITINYNNALGLERTLSSISSQDFRGEFEHIIIDGGSSDNSVSIIKNYSTSGNVVWVSEGDEGIYDAMNKGLSIASNGYIAFLNSGDVLDGADKLSLITQKLKDNTVTDFLYGDLVFVSRDGSITRRWTAGKFQKWKLYFGWMPPHPMTVIKKSLLESVGGFNVQFKIAADYDLFLRLILTRKIAFEYLAVNTVKMEVGGVSNSSLLGIIRSNVEVVNSWIGIRGLIVPYWIFFTKPLLKFRQFRKFQSQMWVGK